MDTGVQAQTRGGRLAVRGIADDQHPSVPVAVGEHPFYGPSCQLVQGQIQAGQAEDLADPGDHRLLVGAVKIAGGEVQAPFL